MNEAITSPLYDEGAERAVLACALIDLSTVTVERLRAELEPEAFYKPIHRLAYEALLDLANRGIAADPSILASELKRRGKLTEQNGGIDYLVGLLEDMFSSSRSSQYARAVRERAVARKVVDTCRQICSTFISGEYGDLNTALDESEMSFLRAARREFEGGVEHIASVVERTSKALEDIRAGKLSGIRTGWADIDAWMNGGLQNKELYVIAARPAMGKTAFAVSLMLQTARAGVHSLIFSLEMASEQLCQRLFSQGAKVRLSSLRAGKLIAEDVVSLTGAQTELPHLPMWLDDGGGQTIAAIRSKARRWKRECVPAGQSCVVLVDYIQLIESSGVGEDQREREVAKISRALKAMSKELNCPVIALAQLNRKCEERPDKRPMCSDLRESGAIEQDADAILFLYRDEVYNPHTERRPNLSAGQCEVIFGKYRQGAVGTVRLAYNAAYTQFADFVEFETTPIPVSQSDASEKPPLHGVLKIKKPRAKKVEG